MSEKKKPDYEKMWKNFNNEDSSIVCWMRWGAVGVITAAALAGIGYSLRDYLKISDSGHDPRSSYAMSSDSQTASENTPTIKPLVQSILDSDEDITISMSRRNDICRKRDSTVPYPCSGIAWIPHTSQYFDDVSRYTCPEGRNTVGITFQQKGDARYTLDDLLKLGLKRDVASLVFLGAEGRVPTTHSQNTQISSRYILNGNKIDLDAPLTQTIVDVGCIYTFQ